MAYSGKFLPTNTGKYAGDPANIVFRSLWERSVFKWCDSNPDVVKWSSEEVGIPYRYKGKSHTYWPDLLLEFANGQMLLVEIKPKWQTTKPLISKKKKPASRKTARRYLREQFIWEKNQCKWEAAEKWCNGGRKSRFPDIQFVLWTEETLKSMGIRIISPSLRRRKKKKATHGTSRIHKDT